MPVERRESFFDVSRGEKGAVSSQNDDLVPLIPQERRESVRQPFPQIAAALAGPLHVGIAQGGPEFRQSVLRRPGHEEGRAGDPLREMKRVQDEGAIEFRRFAG